MVVHVHAVLFSSLNYADMEPAAVDATLEAGRLVWTAETDGPLPLERLGQLLGVDAVVVGEALALGQTYALVYANQQAGLRVRMLRCSTGQVIWEMEHTVTLHEGDLPLSLPGLAAAIVKTAFNYQQSNTLRAASELCMQMTASIPNPTAEAESPPPIQTLVHNGAAGLLAPGDELRVVMIGGNGLTEAVIKETARALAAHELIKIRCLGDDRAAREAWLAEICAQTGCAPVQHIGKLLLVYKPAEEPKLQLP